tara:strand:- start:9999 stop:10136 length:138 start_codon:yes stop_codon:yes gene_type:complete
VKLKINKYEKKTFELSFCRLGIDLKRNGIAGKHYDNCGNTDWPHT